MEERHEIIEFPKDLHMKVFLHKIGSVSRHWHRSLELLFVIEGHANVRMDENAYAVSKGDIILINSNSIHELYSKDGTVLITMQLKPELFKFGKYTHENLEFICNSSEDPHPERYDNIRWAISQMVINNINKHSGTDYMNYGICFYLLSELVSFYQSDNIEPSLARYKHAERLSEILNYVETHYAEDFKLSDLAASLHLSVPYLSSFFSRYMGVKFTQYYTDIKLKHALEDLISTDHTLDQIAVNNGFQEVHSFIRSFKAKYHMTPNIYRKKVLNFQLFPNNDETPNYLELEPSNYLSYLLKYQDNNALSSSTSFARKSTASQISVPNVNCGKVRRRLVHTFKNVMSVGRAKDLLNHDIRHMLQDIQSTIGYKYIKFHGILSDDMMVCMRSSDGSLHFHYQLVDSALEFLLSIGLKPIVQLSFMPTELARDPDKTVFANPFNTSPPKDMSEWNLLIGDFTQHLISYFGRNEVTTWLFCVWCEPDTPVKMFGFGDFELFCEFYRNTYETVKSVCKDIPFGSPGFFHLRRWGEPAFLSNFIRYTLANNCRPDFLNIHYYSDIFSNEVGQPLILRASSSQLPKDTDDFANFITYIHKLFKNLGVGELPVYMTEWNLTFSHRNLINDTCFKSCYILKNLLENYDRLESFGYWSLTDLIEENPLPDNKHVFHGGLGIYTMNGARKNVFYAFDFANRLGNELLAQGEGYFVTRHNGRIQIITYHYVHYGDIFASGDAIGITDTERYTPFDMSRKLALSIPLSGLVDGPYIAKEFFVNRNRGSAFDLWVDSGGMPLSSSDQKLLRNSCAPGLHFELLECRNGNLTYSPTLEPLEIRFAEIYPENG